MENIFNSNSNKIGNNYESTLRAFVGKNGNYFINQFKNIESSNKVNYSWIWLIGGFWLLYRKMYTYFILSLIPIVNIFICINMIINSNKIYYKFVCKKIEKDGLTGKDITNEEKELAIAKKHGGTSYVGIIVFLLTTVLLTAILYGSIIAIFSSYTNDYTEDAYSDSDYSEEVNNESEDLISIVYNCYFDYFSEEETVGEAFDGFFTNTEWSVNIENGINYIYFFGTAIDDDNELIGIGVIFTVNDDDSVEITEAYIGDEKVDEKDIQGFFEVIFDN